MFERDSASQGLGMSIVKAEPGEAVIKMTVAPQHLNGLDVCHGGFIFSLADSAMAFASNAANQPSFAVHASIQWLQPAKLGHELTATARRVAQQGRNSVYDIEVAADDGLVIAVFRGQTRDVGGTYIG